jgi:hypothetical protein
MGQSVSAAAQGQTEAWAHTTFYVDPAWEHPVLSFKYQMHANDIVDYFDVFVVLQLWLVAKY